MPRAQTENYATMENSREKEQLTKEQLDILWQAVCIDLSQEYALPPEMLWVHGSTIGTLGNFSASTGKAKSKKTFNVSAIVAAALKNGQVLQYVAKLPEDKRKVLYVDTEQSHYHCHKVAKRILTMAGLPTDRSHENLQFVALREYVPKVRIEIINHIIDNTEGLGLVVIDGIRDLMYDINNPSEATDLINLLMKWTSRYNMHIHTVLHLNKSDDNIRGHIGTELSNKAETVLQISPSKKNKDISEVQAMHIRDREFSPFAFRINSDAFPEIVEGYVFEGGSSSKKISFEDLPEEEHHKALEKAFAGQSIQGYSNVIAALEKGYACIGYVRKRNTLIKLNTFLKENGMIVPDGKGYRHNPEAELRQV